MPMRSLLFLFLALSFSAAHAQGIELKGHITSTDGTIPPTVNIQSAMDESTNLVAPVSKGDFSLVVPLTFAGVYNLRFLNASYEIMLSPADPEPHIAVTIEAGRLKDVVVKFAKDNDAYKELLPVIKAQDEKLRKHFTNCEAEEKCGKELHDLLTTYRDELTSIQNKYKGTYTAETLCAMKMPVIAKDVKNTAAEYRAGFFQKVPFADRSILTNAVYKDMIYAYVEFLIEPKISREDAFIKDLMKKSAASQAVLTKSADILYEALFRRSREKMLILFIDWYKENKAVVNNPVVELKIQNITPVMPGQRYKDIIRRDTSGKIVSLKEVVDKSTCTLLLFWSSECSHCREEMPAVQEAYEKYHAKGLEIYALSLEQDAAKWKQYIRDNKLPWINVGNMMEAPGNPMIEYMVTSTPSLILISREGVILHRFAPKNKLDKYIGEALK